MIRVKKTFAVLLALLLCALCALPAFAEEDPSTCAHEWEWVTDTEPTCAPGAKHEYCAKCGSSRMKNTYIAPVQEHTWAWVTDTAATCLPGVKHYECAVCGAVSAAGTVIPAVQEHAWSVTEAKNSENCVPGFVRETCAVCGSTRETSLPAAQEHSWQWVVDSPASRYSAGSQHEECTVCHAVRNLNTHIAPTEQGFDFGAAMHQWIDTVGNFFLNIINQIRAMFSGARA